MQTSTKKLRDIMTDLEAADAKPPSSDSKQNPDEVDTIRKLDEYRIAITNILEANDHKRNTDSSVMDLIEFGQEKNESDDFAMQDDIEKAMRSALTIIDKVLKTRD